MLGALSSVSMFEAPGASMSLDDNLTRAARDFLANAGEMPFSKNGCLGSTALEALVIEAINRESVYWSAWSKRHFDPGIQSELFLDNGPSLYPLQAALGFKGLTQAVPFDPTFSFLHVASEIGIADGQSRLSETLLGIFDASLIRAHGEAVRAVVHTQGYEKRIHHSAWGLTALAGGEARTDFAQNLSWDIGEQVPRLATDLALYDLIDSMPAKKYAVNIEPALTAEEAISIPAGTTLSVDVPSAWQIHQIVAEGWRITGTAPLQLQLERASKQAEQIELHLKPPANPLHPYDVLHARLGNGSLGESSLVVTYPTSVERSLPRTVHPTVPYPLRPGTRALFGVAFANGGDKTVVTQVDLEIPGGYDVWRNDGEGAELFARADFLRPSDQDGAWTWLDARHVRWTGSRVVEGLGASSWTVGVLVTDDAGEATSLEPAYSDGPSGKLTFSNGFEHVSRRWGAVPGVVRHDVPPASGPGADDGYPWASAEGVDAVHAVQLSSVGATLRGTGRYEVSAAAGDLLRVQSALANSTFAVRERKVPVGGLLQSDADFESLVNELGRAGVADTTLTMEMYAPPSRGCAPTATWTRSSASMPLARVRDLAVWDAEGVGITDLFLVADDGQA